jgi:hypothetical protein
MEVALQVVRHLFHRPAVNVIFCPLKIRSPHMVRNAYNPNEEEKKQAEQDANKDPLSGRAGAHPVGTGIGAAAGGVAAGAATGAVVGTVAGPVGTAVGAAIGAVAGAIGGGLAGKAIAEKIDPTEEHGYWRNEFSTRPYVSRDATYEEYAPAYQYGWESRIASERDSFEESEAALAKDWERARGASCKLSWDQAKPAVRESWYRVSAYADRNPE